MRARISGALQWNWRPNRLTWIDVRQVERSEETACAGGHLGRERVLFTSEGNQDRSGAKVVQRGLEDECPLHAGRAQILVPGARQIGWIVVLGADAEPEVGVFDDQRSAEGVSGDGGQVGHAEGKAHQDALWTALERQGIRASRER